MSISTPHSPTKAAGFRGLLIDEEGVRGRRKDLASDYPRRTGDYQMSADIVTGPARSLPHGRRHGLSTWAMLATKRCAEALDALRGGSSHGYRHYHTTTPAQGWAQRHAQQGHPEFGVDQRVTASGWGNAGPLSLLAFAVVTLMISLVNVKAISADVAPAVVAVGLIFGGTTQLIGGLIQLRNGNTFQGVLFSSFGAFWISLAAILEWFLKTVPAHHQGQALRLLLYGFTPLVLVLWLASFRTSVVVVVALGTVLVTFVLLAAGNYGGSRTSSTSPASRGSWRQRSRSIWRWRSSASTPTAGRCSPFGL